MLRTLLLLPACLLPLAASAVLIDSGDGTGNTSAPSPDPGWDHVGERGSLTAVYLDNGWVIATAHGGLNDVVLGGVTYSRIPGSQVQISNGDGSDADLVLYAITPQPPLPPLPIASSTPSNGAELILIGNGRDRGAAITCVGPPVPPIGYDWASSRTLRWGTNFVEAFSTVTIGERTTESFGSVFDEGGSDHEAQVVNGDSGGAAFVWNGAQWELAGVLFGLQSLPSCVEDSTASFYGDKSWVADLSVYRDQILDVIALPEPAGGLPLGAALLAALARRRRSG